MSIAITVETDQYRIGVIHAAAPDDWQQVMSPETVDEEEWLWSRKQFEDAATGKTHVVRGVDAVVHGHVSNYKTVSGNHIWIDTLFHSGLLTIIEATDVVGSVNTDNSAEDKKRLDALKELSELDQELDLGY